MNANYMEKGNALRLSPRAGLKCAKGWAMNFDKIVKNPVNIDKFTMYFDKKRARKKTCKMLKLNEYVSKYECP